MKSVMRVKKVWGTNFYLFLKPFDLRKICLKLLDAKYISGEPLFDGFGLTWETWKPKLRPLFCIYNSRQPYNWSAIPCRRAIFRIVFCSREACLKEPE